MNEPFVYNGERFKPYRKMTKAEREQPLENIHEKIFRYYNEEFEKNWDLEEFTRTSKSDADFFWWRGKLIIPGWDSIYYINGWL